MVALHSTSQVTALYDGSFEGFLSLVFQCTLRKMSPQRICAATRHEPELFEETLLIATDSVQSSRVWDGLVRRCGPSRAAMFQCAFLSELPDIERDLWCFQEQAFRDPTGRFAQNVLEPCVLKLYQTAQKVRHEVHRFTGFVRFQEGADGVLYAAIEPEYNIVELLAGHFEARYPSSPWLIVDARRHLGIHYDGATVHTVAFLDGLPMTRYGQPLADAALDPGEAQSQALWRSYYAAINIPERRNLKLMLRCLPRKYWKYLPERA